jgi:hypothetical protein
MEMSHFVSCLTWEINCSEAKTICSPNYLVLCVSDRYTASQLGLLNRPRTVIRSFFEIF